MKTLTIASLVLLLTGCLSVHSIYYTYPLPVQSYRGTVAHFTQFPVYNKTAPGSRTYGTLKIVFAMQSVVDLFLGVGLETLLLPATLPVDIYGIFHPDDFKYYRARAIAEER